MIEEKNFPSLVGHWTSCGKMFVKAKVEINNAIDELLDLSKHA